LPWGCVGKQLLESGDLSGHVGAGVVLGQESRQAFLEKALPRLVFKTGVDRVEEDPVRFGGLKVTWGVAVPDSFTFTQPPRIEGGELIWYRERHLV